MVGSQSSEIAGSLASSRNKLAVLHSPCNQQAVYAGLVVDVDPFEVVNSVQTSILM